MYMVFKAMDVNELLGNMNGDKGKGYRINL